MFAPAKKQPRRSACIMLTSSIRACRKSQANRVALSNFEPHRLAPKNDDPVQSAFDMSPPIRSRPDRS